MSWLPPPTIRCHFTTTADDPEAALKLPPADTTTFAFFGIALVLAIALGAIVIALIILGLVWVVKSGDGTERTATYT